MIKFYEIPKDIVMQQEVRAVRKKCPNWPDRKMLSTYMDAYSRGVKEYNEQRPMDEQPLELTHIAIYYIVRQEFLRRLTPFVILRSKKYLVYDNSSLLRKLDHCLENGVETCSDETTGCINEIINRMQ